MFTARIARLKVQKMSKTFTSIKDIRLCLGTEVCPACVVATVMRMKPGEEETLLQDGSTETRDVELKHILFAHVNDHLLYGDDDIPRFSTYTDHQRLTRWGLILQAYNLIIKHIKATIRS